MKMKTEPCWKYEIGDKLRITQYYTPQPTPNAAAEFYDAAGNPPKKYGASRRPPNNIQISAAEYFSAEPMTSLDLCMCTHVIYRSVA